MNVYHLALRIQGGSGARLFHSSCVCFKRSVRGSMNPVKQYNYGELMKETEGYIRETGSMPSTSLSGEALADSINFIKKDMARKHNTQNFKLIEHRYFKNLYKIKPGEAYTRAKDPYFKKVKNNSDFHHPHHFTIKKSSYIQYDHDPVDDIKEIERYSKVNQTCNPLNPVHLASHLYGHNDNSKHMKSNSKYRAQKVQNLAPKEAYGNKTKEMSGECFDDAKNKISRNQEENSTNSTSLLNYKGHSLLTFAMKEQMRYLYTSDPENWSPEALSLIYPVAPSVVSKIVKSNWKPDNEESLVRHDLRVVKNWKKFTKGKVNSVALIEEIIERRKNGSINTESSVPALTPTSEQMEDILSKLHFDGLDKDLEERARGTVISNPKQRHVPRGGYWVDIVKKYETDVNKMASHTEEIEGSLINDVNKQHKQLPMASQEEINKLLPEVNNYEGEWVGVRTNIGGNSENKLKLRNGKRNQNKTVAESQMTYQEYLKNEKS